MSVIENYDQYVMGRRLAAYRITAEEAAEIRDFIIANRPSFTATIVSDQIAKEIFPIPTHE